MREAAVIGNPVSHSRSPAIFSFLAKAQGFTDFRYSAIQVLPSELSRFISVLRSKPEYLGLNVTIPHKELIRSELDDLSPEARAIGAVNVVQAREGRLLGHNTDVFGVVRTLAEHRAQVSGKNAWIYGAGGAARATAYGLGSLGARSVVIQNRTLTRAEAIALDLKGLFPQTRFEARADAPRKSDADADRYSLVVNSTSVGMRGASSDLVADADFFSGLEQLPLESGAVAFDLIYNPERTIFLILAEKAGLRPVGGLDMLIHQALATWEIWFGESLPLQRELGAHLRKLMSEDAVRDRPIFLAGFMGAGKTSVGALLARQMSWNFVDTDSLIVQKAGMPVPRIFAEQGEAAFRKFEFETIEKATMMSRTVVALGGGALMNPENLKKIQADGCLIYLEASPESLLQRLENTGASRPLLAGLGTEERRTRIVELLQKRKPVYEQARIRVETDGRRPEEIAREIADKVGFRRPGGSR